VLEGQGGHGASVVLPLMHNAYMAFPPTAARSSSQSRRTTDDLPSELYPEPKIRWYPNVEEHPSIWNATGLQQPGRPAKPAPSQSTGGFITVSLCSAHGLDPSGQACGSGRYRASAFYQSEAGLPALDERKTHASAGSRGVVANREDCVFDAEIRVPFSSREQFLKVAVFRVDGTLDLLVGEATVPIADPEVSNTCTWPLLRDFEQQGLVKLSVRLPDPEEEEEAPPVQEAATVSVVTSAAASAAVSPAASVTVPAVAATPSAAQAANAAVPSGSAVVPGAVRPGSAVMPVAAARPGSAVVPPAAPAASVVVPVAAPATPSLAAVAARKLEAQATGGDMPLPPPPPRRLGGPAPLDCATPQTAGYPKGGSQWHARVPAKSPVAHCRRPEAPPGVGSPHGSPHGSPSHGGSPSGATLPSAAALGLTVGAELEVNSRSNGQWLRARVSRTDGYRVTVEYTDRFGDRFKVVDLRAKNLNEHLRFPPGERGSPTELGDASPESSMTGLRSRSARPLADAAPSWAPPVVQARTCQQPEAVPSPFQHAGGGSSPSSAETRAQGGSPSGVKSFPLTPLLQAFGIGPAKPPPPPAPACERIWGAQTVQRRG